MLRERLEMNHPNEYVACCMAHPDDTFIRVDAPSQKAIRMALIQLLSQVDTARTEISRPFGKLVSGSSEELGGKRGENVPLQNTPVRRSQRIGRP
jgi:hypothetical protein